VVTKSLLEDFFNMKYDGLVINVEMRSSEPRAFESACLRHEVLSMSLVRVLLRRENLCVFPTSRIADLD
jgi:hypothetical protein